MSLHIITKSVVFGTLAITFVFGFVTLTDYSSRPAPHTDVLAELPADVHFETSQADKNSPTILLFYHPKCPCTLASARCLARLASRFNGSPNFYAYAYCPAEEPDTWIASSTTDELRTINNVTIFPDRNAEKCKQFGVRISGHILVYNSAGKLVFSGGITPYRGHEGGSMAAMDFIQHANGKVLEPSCWPTFGCSILDAGE